MLVKQFKFKRNNDMGGFQWTAESEIERPGFYRGFHAVGKTLADEGIRCPRAPVLNGRVHWNACRKCTRPVGSNKCRRRGAGIGFRIKEEIGREHRLNSSHFGTSYA